MSHKQRGSGGKKQTPSSTSQIDQAQVQQQLTQYHQIASALHTSTEKAQAEVALAPLTGLSESTQIAFLKVLSKESTVDAADIMSAMNTLAPIKEVRKEAHRSLIRLEETQTYPQWTVPTVQEVNIPAPPARFWKGLMTNSREMGEMQLILCWEQGTNYQEVRMMGFLLEFWHDGVKDFFTEVNSKRHIESHLAQMRSQFVGLEIVDCTLAKGHRLIEEALLANKKHGTKPHKDYMRHLSLIRQLILDVVDTEKDVEDISSDETDSNATVIDALSSKGFFPLSLENEDVVPNFIEAWVEGSYETAYDLLASTSPLREGLSRKEWAERRRQWSAEAHPRQLKNTFIHMPEPQSEQESPTVEIGWSLAFNETPLASALKELPVATLTYTETGRHWFWTSYTLVEEDDTWHIQDMTDEGAKALQLSPDELQKRLTEIVEFTSHQLEEIDEDEDDEVSEDEDVDADDRWMRMKMKMKMRTMKI